MFYFSPCFLLFPSILVKFLQYLRIDIDTGSTSQVSQSLPLSILSVIFYFLNIRVKTGVAKACATTYFLHPKVFSLYHADSSLSHSLTLDSFTYGSHVFKHLFCLTSIVAESFQIDVLIQYWGYLCSVILRELFSTR